MGKEPLMTLGKYRCVTTPGNLGSICSQSPCLIVWRRADCTQRHSTMPRLCQSTGLLMHMRAAQSPRVYLPTAPQGLLGSSLHGL